MNRTPKASSAPSVTEPTRTLSEPFGGPDTSSGAVYVAPQNADTGSTQPKGNSLAKAENHRPLARRIGDADLERRDLAFNERAQVTAARQLWNGIKGLKGPTRDAMAVAIRAYINTFLDYNLNPEFMEHRDAIALARMRQKFVTDIVETGTKWQELGIQRARIEFAKTRKIEVLIERVRRVIPQDVLASGSYNAADPKIADTMIADLEAAEARHA